MTTYPKIETLFDRGEDFAVDTNRFRRPEFGLINRWLVTEKVDGTNIRLVYERVGENVMLAIRGRTDNAQMDPRLYELLRDLGGDAVPEVTKIMDEHDLNQMVLYGEGYGEKIQSGGWYRTGQGFILFDVRAGNSWLDDTQVGLTAERLGWERVPLLEPPFLDDSLPKDRMWWTLEEIVHDVSNGLVSKVAVNERRAMEGVVARPEVPLFDRRGERVMFKLKVKDFKTN